MPDQLAYVFWHWPRPEIPKASYETKLAAFLHSLNLEKPIGFIEALSFRVGSLPWGPQRDNFYEDWYVVENFSASPPTMPRLQARPWQFMIQSPRTT